MDERVEAPAAWDLKTGKNVLWKTEIPGLGLSSPVIWGDDVFITTAVAENADEVDLKVGLYGDIAPSKDAGPQSWRVLCLNREDGEVKWDVEVHAGVPKTKRHTKSSHANPSVATDGDHVVAFFGSEGLYCLNRKGEILWEKSLGVLASGYFKVPSAQWGFASSPVIHGGRIIVQCDIQKGSFLAAYDVKTGDEIWKTERDEVPTWGTPTVVEAGGETQILVNGWKRIGGYEFEDGKPVWWMKGGGDIPVPTPVAAHGAFVITNAHGPMSPIYAIRDTAVGEIDPEASEGKADSPVLWWQRRRGNYMQTPIIVGDLLYCCTDLGVVSCFDLKRGTRHYLERLRDGRSGFGVTASPVSDGKKIYYPTEDGHVFVIETGTAFKRLAQQEIGGASMASPAIVNGTLFFRTRQHMIAIGIGAVPKKGGR